MPTYEYGYIDCGQKFDVFATISQKDKGLELACPNCGSANAVQLFNSVNFVKSNSGNPSKEFQAAGGCGPNATPGCCG